MATLGETLVLPPWLEADRDAIECGPAETSQLAPAELKVRVNRRWTRAGET